MKTLFASLILASLSSTAFAVPASEPFTLLGEALPTHSTPDGRAQDLRRLPVLSENGSARTPQGERLAEDGFDRTPAAERYAEDGFGRTPLGSLIAEDGSARTGIGPA